MRRKLVLFVILLPVICFAGEDVDITKMASSDGLVRIVNVRGDVSISGWDRNEITIKGELDDLAEGLNFEVNSEKALIEVKMPRRDVNWGDGSNLSIHVPAGSRVDFSGVSTEVTIEDISGGARLKSVSGDLRVDNVDDRILANSVSGEIEVVDCEGMLHATTVSGEIDVQKHIGGVAVESISGDIEVETEAADKLRGRSVSGTIEMDAGVIEGTSAELKSVSGDINLDLLGDVNAVLELEAGLGGEIKNSLSNDKIEKAFMGRQKLTTQIGDGASEVVIRTVSADIRIE